MEVTIGGNRLGSGGRMKAELKAYERSTHDIGYQFRSTMAAGTLVPFMVEPGMPADTFDIDLDVDVMTHPTLGPLFGSYKIQLDVFTADMRLYQSALHNNTLNIGRNMSSVKLPVVEIPAYNTTPVEDNSQISPSSILAYLGIRGIGRPSSKTTPAYFYRKFNGTPYIAYWDIYKNYYANKQEDKGYVIHTGTEEVHKTIDYIELTTDGHDTTLPANPAYGEIKFKPTTTIAVYYTGTRPNLGTIIIYGSTGTGLPDTPVALSEFGGTIIDTTGKIEVQAPLNQLIDYIGAWGYRNPGQQPAGKPILFDFGLENIDEMRAHILGQGGTPLNVAAQNYAPYSYIFEKNSTGTTSISQNQEGLGIKTYQSDLFNNWIQTEWIDGENGISEITAIDTSSGEFSIDQLNLAQKVYKMLNRIAISDGSYNAWIETVYDNDRFRNAETPVYHGSLIKELVFQQVISQSSGTGNGGVPQPLGQLAGRGTLGHKHKGGKISIKLSEHAYVIGIVSLTPRIDYSQGNRWFNNIENMDQWHKPALDEIGFQDLITDAMHWADTVVNTTDETVTYKSAGKQPAWINYMTNVNRTYGNFAIETNEMFMTLNRRYEVNDEDGLIDLTTYIDPSKFNFIFAETQIDAQNFWVNIGCDITVRRKMSAKIMPNL